MATRFDQTFRLCIDGGSIHENLEEQPVLFDVVVPPDRRDDLAPDVHVCDGEGAELECRIDRLDTKTGQVRGWVVVPRMQPGVDVEMLLVPGTGRRPFSQQDLAPTVAGALCVEGWIHVDEARPEAVQVVAASWEFATRPTALAPCDAGEVDGQPTQGFFGAVFDGRFIYFAPQCNNKGRHGHALRYDTHMPFDDSAAWRAYDAATTEGLTTKGYYGAVFDGRFVYYVPRFDGDTQHSRVLRLDTTGDFTDSTSWSAFDAGRPISCQGAAFDGRYVYFAPGMHQDDGPSGCVLRLDTLASFHDEGSWVWHDVSTTGGLDCRCFDGAVYDGRHIYFVPLNGGPVVRHDPKLPFAEADAWEAFDTTGLPGFGACVGAVFDGRRVYFVPYAHDTVVCYDTEAPFTAVGSWTAHAPGSVDGLDCRGYDGAAFDGRYVTFVPFWDGETTTDGFHARLLRYDTTLPFTAAEAWQAADGSVLAPPNPGGFNGGAFDGRFLYMAPWRLNDPSGQIHAHGQVLRLDTAAPGSSFQLRWVDCGHNGGLCGAVPGPAFLVNCADGPVCVQAHATVTAGWHHLAGVYSPENGAELWVDGECVARQAARGAALPPAQDITVGALVGGSGSLCGHVAQVRLRSRRLTAGEARTCAANLRAPADFVRLVD